jgi:hypothetical protein
VVDVFDPGDVIPPSNDDTPEAVEALVAAEVPVPAAVLVA